MKKVVLFATFTAAGCGIAEVPKPGEGELGPVTTAHGKVVQATFFPASSHDGSIVGFYTDSDGRTTPRVTPNNHWYAEKYVMVVRLDDGEKVAFAGRNGSDAHALWRVSEEGSRVKVSRRRVLPAGRVEYVKFEAAPE